MPRTTSQRTRSRSSASPYPRPSRTWGEILNGHSGHTNRIDSGDLEAAETLLKMSRSGVSSGRIQSGSTGPPNESTPGLRTNATQAGIQPDEDNDTSIVEVGIQANPISISSNDNQGKSVVEAGTQDNPISIGSNDNKGERSRLVPPPFWNESNKRAQSMVRPNPNPKVKLSIFRPIGPTGKPLTKGDCIQAQRGVEDRSLLVIRACNFQDGELRVDEFEAIPWDELDWDNEVHIHQINAWRLSMFALAGTVRKSHVAWKVHEMHWFDLFIGLCMAKAMEDGTMVRVPPIMKANTLFSDFFKSATLQSFGGPMIVPLDPTYGTFHPQFHRYCDPTIRANNNLISYDEGEKFVPQITEQMWDFYQLHGHEHRTLYPPLKSYPKQASRRQHFPEPVADGSHLDQDNADQMARWQVFYGELLRMMTTDVDSSPKPRVFQPTNRAYPGIDDPDYQKRPIFVFAGTKECSITAVDGMSDPDRTISAVSGYGTISNRANDELSNFDDRTVTAFSQSDPDGEYELDDEDALFPISVSDRDGEHELDEEVINYDLPPSN